MSYLSVFVVALFVIAVVLIGIGLNPTLSTSPAKTRRYIVTGAVLLSVLVLGLLFAQLSSPLNRTGGGIMG